MENHFPVTIDIDQLGQILHKTPGAILVDRVHPKRKLSIPPAIRNTGKKLLWSLETVNNFLKENEEKRNNKDFLNLLEVADELGCAERTLQNQRKQLPFPTSLMFGRVVVSRKHLEEYKKTIVLQSEREFQRLRNEGATTLKRGRGRPKKLPNFAGLGGV